MGIPNLSRVDACVWRSGQPLKAAQWQTIKGLGITHIAKLNFEAEGSEEGARALGMEVQSFSMEPRGDLDVFSKLTHTFKHPDERVVAAADAYISQFAPKHSSSGQPNCARGMLLVHCTHGQDRTGFEIGRYRVLAYGVSKKTAYEEMKAHNFHASLHGIADAWEDWIPPTNSGAAAGD